MNNTAPKWMGMLAVTALFGVVAWIVSYVVFGFAALAAILVGAIVALVVAGVLWLGWRDAAPGPMGPRDLSPASDRETKAAAASAPSAAAAAPVAAAPAAVAEKPTEKPVTPAAKTAAPAPKAAKPQAEAASAAKPVAADGKPEMLDKPRGGAGDDLKQIKGVGPKMEKMLNTMGVWHFDQVASWRKKEVEWVDENLEGFKGRVSRDEWVKQAKVLAKGGTTEFSKKVNKGGVY